MSNLVSQAFVSAAASRGLIALVTGSALIGSVSANVLVVDAGGGGGYTAIQPAVDAADDGDTVLIRAGAYASFAVNNKAIVIVGDTGATVHINGGARVRNLAAGKTLVLENLIATGAPSSEPHSIYGLYLTNNAGHIRVESCALIGFSPPNSGAANGYAAVSVDTCADVALTRTTSTGGGGAIGNAPTQSGIGGPGLSAVNSSITLYDATLQGGIGDSASPDALGIDGGSGGTGCSVSNTVLFASGSRILGGNGGQGGDGPFLMTPAYGGEGGAGVQLSNGSIARLLDDVTHGGSGGPAGFGDGASPGGPGPARVATSGSSFIDLAGMAKRMTSPTPVRENTVSQLSFTGAPGDQVALIVSNDADQKLKLAWRGVLLVKTSHPMYAVPIGTIPASGTLVVPWGVSDLGAAQSALFHMQPVFVGAQGDRTLGTASCMVILDASY